MTNFLSKTSFWEKAIGYERKLTAQKYLLKNSKNVGMAVDSDCGSGSCSGTGCGVASCSSCASASCSSCASAS